MATGDRPEVVSREEWLAAPTELLAKEKELTRHQIEVNAARRRLPMVRIDKPYTFEGPGGTVSLLDLFEGRPQLVMHHFMWINDIDADGTEHPRDAGCSSCSSAADGIGHLRQLHVRNTTLVAVSRAPWAKIAAFRERMGWTFPWYSSAGSDFNYDFHATGDDRSGHALDRRPARRLARHQRLPPGRRGGIPHLLHVRPRHRRVPQRLSVPQPYRPGSSGGMARAEGTGARARPAGRRPEHAPPRRIL